MGKYASGKRSLAIPDLSDIANDLLPDAYLPIILHLHRMFAVK